MEGMSGMVARLFQGSSWFLAIVVALQPAMAFPCSCKAGRGDAAEKTTKRHDCCHKLTASRSPAAVAITASAECSLCSLRDHQACCSRCNGGCSCVGRCALRTALPLLANTPPRLAPDDWFASSQCVHCAAIDVVANVHPAWAVHVFPACGSALHRCIVLCRWLI